MAAPVKRPLASAPHHPAAFALLAGFAQAIFRSPTPSCPRLHAAAPGGPGMNERGDPSDLDGVPRLS